MLSSFATCKEVAWYTKPALLCKVFSAGNCTSGTERTRAMTTGMVLSGKQTQRTGSGWTVRELFDAFVLNILLSFSLCFHPNRDFTPSRTEINSIYLYQGFFCALYLHLFYSYIFWSFLIIFPFYS